MSAAVSDLFDRIAALAGRDDAPDALVALLPEQATIYDGLGSGEAERVRARIFAALAGAALPRAALPFILEELETGIVPATTAAAATALASASGPVAEAETLLLKAAVRLAAADAPLPLSPGRTALQDVLAALAALPSAGEASIEALNGMLAAGTLSAATRAEAERALAILRARTASPAPPCCAAKAGPTPPTAARTDSQIRLQDQSGKRLSFAGFFSAEPSVLAFFYTRCMNPERCSLTVTKLGRLQARIAGRGLAERVRIGAISYDPAYDLPPRLAGYGSDRGFRFDARNRFFRTTGPVEPVRARFDLGVGYGPTTVNRHRLDLFVLDARGEVTASFARRLWDEDQVAEAVAALCATAS